MFIIYVCCATGTLPLAMTALWSKHSNGNFKSTGTESDTVRRIRRREKFNISTLHDEHLRDGN